MGEFFPCTGKVTLRYPIPDPENYKKRRYIFNNVLIHAGNMLQMFRMEVSGKNGIHLVHIPVWNLCSIDVMQYTSQEKEVLDGNITTT